MQPTRPLRPPAPVLVITLLLAGCGTPPVYTRTPGLGSDGGTRADSGAPDSASDANVIGGTGGILGTATGGAVGSGGMPGSGGAVGTGGAGSGGAGTGGAARTGGAPGSGGMVGTGGLGSGGNLTGGATGSGGMGTGGAASGGAGSGGAGSGGRGGAGTGGATAVDTARYNFESSLQGWAAPSGTLAFMNIARNTTTVYAGQGSLAGTIAATAASKYQLGVAPSPAVAAGATVTYHLWIPAGAPINWVQPYVQEGSPNYVWTGTTVPGTNLTFGAWNTITVRVPSTAAAIGQLGVQFDLGGAWNGTVYIDSVNW